MGYDTQFLLIDMTYNDEYGMELSKALSDKIQNDTGMEGDIGTFGGLGLPAGQYLVSNDKNVELTPTETFAEMVTYQDLMDVALMASKKGDVETIYGIHKFYDNGIYKEAYLNNAKNQFFNQTPYDLAGPFMSVVEQQAVKQSFLAQFLPNFMKNFLEYKGYRVPTKNKGDAYSVPFDKNFSEADLSLFSSLAPEYALLKYNVYSVETMAEMEMMFMQNMFRRTTTKEDNLARAKANMFQSQALAGTFANAISIREVAQRYVNARKDFSALGTEANNDRSNWYALNVMTTGLIKILGYEAILDAGNLEYEASMRIKKVEKYEADKEITKGE
ncbi:MAG: hypothetical protein BWY78_00874 [Alphaproteobacteria bacterium ADurb.Bin438]|nr:MAG: hypothetical protein BWY78_00874 [Alphaproteobacteria bacterium ADurb.Bin438]